MGREAEKHEEFIDQTMKQINIMNFGGVCKKFPLNNAQNIILNFQCLN